jgi:hypothetical protein
MRERDEDFSLAQPSTTDVVLINQALK